MRKHGHTYRRLGSRNQRQVWRRRQVKRRRVDRPPLLDGRFTDLEGAAGVQERRGHAQHLHEHGKTEQKDETGACSRREPASDAAASWINHLLHPALFPLIAANLITHISDLKYSEADFPVDHLRFEI